MKQVIVSFQFEDEYFTTEQNTSFKVKPSDVEVEKDSWGFPKNTDNFPTVRPTRDMRGKGKIEGTISKSIRPNSLCFLEFGIETLEENDFRFLLMPINMNAQRWFLNIWTMDENEQQILFTSQTIEEILNRLEVYIEMRKLMPILLVDFIERLFTDENLKLISELTAQPKNEKKSIDVPYKTLQAVENTEQLRDSILGWLANIEYEEVAPFIDKFHEFLDCQEDDNTVRNYVDNQLHPKRMEYFIVMERILEWYSCDYSGRTLTDESMKFIVEGRFKEIAKQVVEKATKKGSSYYVKGGMENVFLSEDIKIGADGSDFIEEQGHEIFMASLRHSLESLGFKIIDILSFYNDYDFEMNVDCCFSVAIEKIMAKVKE